MMNDKSNVRWERSRDGVIEKIITTAPCRCTFKDSVGYFICYTEDIKKSKVLKPPKWCFIWHDNCLTCEFFYKSDHYIDVVWEQSL